MYTTSIYLSSDYIDLVAGLRGELSGSGEMEHLLTHFNSTLALANGTVFAGPLDMLNVMRDYFASALSTHNWLTQLDRKGVQEKLRRMFFQVAYPTDAKMADDDAAGGGAPAWPLQTPFLILNGLLGDELLTNYFLAARLSMLLTFKYIEVAPDPFFNSASPSARNYWSIGCILGHEMSHALDDEVAGSTLTATCATGCSPRALPISTHVRSVSRRCIAPTK